MDGISSPLDRQVDGALDRPPRAAPRSGRGFSPGQSNVRPFVLRCSVPRALWPVGPVLYMCWALDPGVAFFACGGSATPESRHITRGYFVLTVIFLFLPFPGHPCCVVPPCRLCLLRSVTLCVAPSVCTAALGTALPRAARARGAMRAPFAGLGMRCAGRGWCQPPH